MKIPKPYLLADQTIARLNKISVRLKTECKKRLLVVGFDDLNVMREVSTLYAELNRQSKKEWRELWVARYLEMLAFMSVTPPGDDVIDDLVEMELAGLLGEPSPITHYVYDAEILRKRDRAIEAVNSVFLKVKKQAEIDRAVRIWSQMKNWYTDEVADSANLSAMKTAGVKKVQWHTQEDDLVCVACNSNNGKTYPIDKIPAKPHPNCRCWVSPV